MVFLDFKTNGQFVEPRGVESSARPAGGDQRRLPVLDPGGRPGRQGTSLASSESRPAE